MLLNDVVEVPVETLIREDGDCCQDMSGLV